MNFDAFELTGGDLYFQTPDGDWQYFTTIKSLESSGAEGDYYVASPRLPTTFPSSIDISGEVKIVGYGRCKTRKRLVKLLMSKGFQKLAAQEIAWEVNKSSMTYQGYWLHYVLTGDVGIYFWSKTKRIKEKF